MEQKKTINFGAGPAKLPQSVSWDVCFVCERDDIYAGKMQEYELIPNLHQAKLHFF